MNGIKLTNQERTNLTDFTLKCTGEIETAMTAQFGPSWTDEQRGLWGFDLVFRGERHTSKHGNGAKHFFYIWDVVRTTTITEPEVVDRVCVRSYYETETPIALFEVLSKKKFLIPAVFV